MSRRTEQAAYDRGHKAGAKAGRRIGEMDGWDSGFMIGAMAGGGFVLVIGLLVVALAGVLGASVEFFCAVMP